MKIKLLVAMFVFTFQINGMEQVYDADFIEHRVEELNAFYQNQSRLWENRALVDLEKLFNEDTRRWYFEEFVSTSSDITDNEAVVRLVNEALILVKSRLDNIPSYPAIDRTQNIGLYQGFMKSLPYLISRYGETQLVN